DGAEGRSAARDRRRAEEAPGRRADAARGEAGPDRAAHQSLGGRTHDIEGTEPPPAPAIELIGEERPQAGEEAAPGRMERFEAAAEGDGRVGAPDPHDGSVEVGEGPLADDGGDLPAAAGRSGPPRTGRCASRPAPAPARPGRGPCAPGTAPGWSRRRRPAAGPWRRPGWPGRRSAGPARWRSSPRRSGSGTGRRPSPRRPAPGSPPAPARPTGSGW